MTTMKNFHKYATLKTSGQLVMDLGSVTTHIAALVALLKSTNVNDNPLTQFFCWFLVGTIIFQVMNTQRLKATYIFIMAEGNLIILILICCR